MSAHPLIAAELADILEPLLRAIIGSLLFSTDRDVATYK
jgi:hypothetical protein